MRRIFMILGVVLGVLVAAGVAIFMQASRPTVIEVPVAKEYIPAGTVLHSDMFRVAKMANIDSDTKKTWVTVNEWKNADGKMTTSDIRTGFPIAKAQIDPNTPNGVESRLSLALTGTNDYYAVIPVNPDMVGNFVQPGDHVDLILTLKADGFGDGLVGPITVTESAGAQPAPPPLNPDGLYIQQSSFPAIKVMMQNLTVLRVEREQPRVSKAQTNKDGTPVIQPEVVRAVQRLYVKVDRDQLELLGFSLNSGKRNIVVRAATGNDLVAPTDGIDWEDFVRWFYQQKGPHYMYQGKPDGSQPFSGASPYTRAVEQPTPAPTPAQ